MQWLDMLWPIAAALAVMLLPGLAVVWPLGIRGFRILPFAVAVSVGLIALAAIVAPFAGLSWNILPVLMLTAAAVLAVLILRRFIPGTGGATTARRQRSPAAAEWSTPRGRDHLPWYAVALAIATLLWIWLLVRILGTPDAFSQTYDNIHHLSLTQWFITTGNASSLTAGDVGIGLNEATFYPSAWHGVAALLNSLGVSSIPMAFNAMMLILVVFGWTAGMLYFVSTLARLSIAGTLTVPVFAASFSGFPFLMIDFGVLYPNFMGLSLLPVVLGLAVELTGIGKGSRMPALLTLLSLILVAPGVLISHPNTIFVFALFGIPVALIRAFVEPLDARREGRRFPLGRIVLYLGAAVAMASAWIFLRPGVDTWPPQSSTLAALTEFLFANPRVGKPSYLLGALLVIGVLWLVRTRTLAWLAGPLLTITFFWVVIASFEASEFRSFLTGVWYDDPFRIASITPLIVLPLVALPINSAGLWAEKRMIEGRFTGITPVIPIASTLVLAVITQTGAAVDNAVYRAAYSYEMRDNSWLITHDEMSLIEQLPALTPDDAVLVTRPWTGSGLAFVFADRQVTMLSPKEIPNPAVEVINNQLDNPSDLGQLCAAVDEVEATHVLDFGKREINNWFNDTPGLDNLGNAWTVELVYEIGEARLFEITACR